MNVNLKDAWSDDVDLLKSRKAKKKYSKDFKCQSKSIHYTEWSLSECYVTLCQLFGLLLHIDV